MEEENKATKNTPVDKSQTEPEECSNGSSAMSGESSDTSPTVVDGAPTPETERPIASTSGEANCFKVPSSSGMFKFKTSGTKKSQSNVIDVSTGEESSNKSSFDESASTPLSSGADSVRTSDTGSDKESSAELCDARSTRPARKILVRRSPRKSSATQASCRSTDSESSLEGPPPRPLPLQIVVESLDSGYCHSPQSSSEIDGSSYSPRSSSETDDDAQNSDPVETSDDSVAPVFPNAYPSPEPTSPNPLSGVSSLADIPSIVEEEDVRRANRCVASTSEGVRKRKSDTSLVSNPPFKQSLSIGTELSRVTQDQLRMTTEEEQTKAPVSLSVCQASVGQERSRPPLRRSVSQDLSFELESNQPDEEIGQQEGQQTAYEEMCLGATNTSSAEEHKEDDRQEASEKKERGK